MEFGQRLIFFMVSIRDSLLIASFYYINKTYIIKDFMVGRAFGDTITRYFINDPVTSLPTIQLIQSNLTRISMIIKIYNTC